MTEARCFYIDESAPILGYDADDLAAELVADGVEVLTSATWGRHVSERDFFGHVLLRLDSDKVRVPEIRAGIVDLQQEAARVLAGNPKTFMAFMDLAAEAGIPMGGDS